MNDQAKTKIELIEEISVLQQRIQELEKSEAARNRADEALKLSEATYREIFNTINDTIWVHDIETGAFLDVNNKVTEMFGYSVREAMNLSVEDISAGIPPFIQETAVELLRKAAAGEPQLFEWLCRHKDGHLFWTEVNLKQGSIAGKECILAIERNITERKQTEEALRESEEKYRLLIENSHDIIYILNPDGVFSFVSPSWTPLLGHTTDQVIGKTYQQFVHPDDVGRCEAFFQQAVKTGQHQSDIEYRVQHTDGRWRWHASSAVPTRDMAGTVVGYEGIARDITERKRAEEEVRKGEENYRLLFENAGEGILLAQDEKIQFANPALVEMLGYPRDIITTRPFISFLHPEDRTKVLDRHLRRLKGESLPTDYTFRIVTEDGTEKWLQIKSKIVSWNGAPASLSFVEDVTDRKHMESQLIQAQKLEAIGTLSGGMAHNFNNILTGIQGYASLMRMNLKPDHPHYESLKIIEEQVQSGAQLTRQLLGFAQGGQCETISLDINQLLSRSATLFGKAKKEVVMHMSLSKGPLAVVADQNQLDQVFLNLFMNASQAMPSGGNIHLETQAVVLSSLDVETCGVAPGAYVKITATDTGEGMDEKTQSRIFEPFFTTKPLGTGLGLSTVYGIVRGHRGFITVDSKVGHGTTFTLYLPATEQEVVSDKMAVTEILTGAETILVVDDEKAAREVGKAFLESLGYRVYVVGSGQEAMAVYMEKLHEIDLIVLDMIMPGISGGETFDRLREINPGVMVLLCSGYSIDGEAQKVMERGCNGFLQKPFHLEKLSQKVREILNS